MSFDRPPWWCRMGRHEMNVSTARDAETGEKVLVGTCAWCGATEIRPLPPETEVPSS